MKDLDYPKNKTRESPRVHLGTKSTDHEVTDVRISI